MDWWDHFLIQRARKVLQGSAKARGELIRCVRLTLPGWSEDPPREEDARLWLNSYKETLGLQIHAHPHPCFERGDELEVRGWARNFAQSQRAGLIEVRIVDREFRLIFKELGKTAYYYTGMLFTCVKGVWLVWITVARELGTIGVRERAVTAILMKEGKLSSDERELQGGQDPYEPAYHGVDPSVLRFVSDDESYDQQFPQHPLSKVRRILATLSKHVEYDFAIPTGQLDSRTHDGSDGDPVTQSQQSKSPFLKRCTSIVTRFLQGKWLDSLFGTPEVPEANSLRKDSLGLKETSRTQLVDRQESTTVDFISRNLETETIIRGMHAEEAARSVDELAIFGIGDLIGGTNSVESILSGGDGYRLHLPSTHTGGGRHHTGRHCKLLPGSI
jgi:hypothetical protein